MFRVDNSSAASTLPAPRPAGTPGYFTEGDPLAGTEPTIVDQDFMNSVQEEICNVIAAAAITLDKTNRSQLLASLNRLFLPRVLVTANMTIYVNPTTGNDANNGLTVGSPFRTIQAAINAVYNLYNWNGWGCTIQLADGTYNYAVTGGANANFYYRPLGMPDMALTLLGNPGNPDNVQINATLANCILVTGFGMNINGVSFTATGTSWTVTQTSGMGLALGRGAFVALSNWRAKNCGMFGLRVDSGSILVFQGSNNKINGTSVYAGFFAGEGGMIWCPTATLDVTGLSTINGTVISDQGRLELETMTFIGAGSCTGPRYNAGNCGVILTAGGGANYIPGSTPGSASGNGVYA